MADKFSINMAEKRLEVKNKGESQAELKEIKTRLDDIVEMVNVNYENILHIGQILGAKNESGNILQG